MVFFLLIDKNINNIIHSRLFKINRVTQLFYSCKYFFTRFFFLYIQELKHYSGLLSQEYYKMKSWFIKDFFEMYFCNLIIKFNYNL